MDLTNLEPPHFKFLFWNRTWKRSDVISCELNEAYIKDAQEHDSISKLPSKIPYTQTRIYIFIFFRSFLRYIQSDLDELSNDWLKWNSPLLDISNIDQAGLLK